MIKRAVSVFLLLVLGFAGLGFRISAIGKSSLQAANSAGSMSVDVALLRGTVYDCDMRPMTNSEKKTYAAAKPTNHALAVLKTSVSAELFETVKERMSEGKPVTVEIESAPDISPDVKIFTVPERYNNSLACHVIGYLDAEKRGVSGIEKAYDSLLSADLQRVTVRFFANANGRVLIGEDITVEGNRAPKSGVVLTIDGGVQRITEAALDISDAECAAAVVTEIDSGAIRACVSRPAFNQSNIAYSLKNEKSPLINRAFLPFSVGSVFKPVVAAAALESGKGEGFEYNCTGSVTHNGVTFNCHKDEGHGILNLEQAVAYSCNTYFIALALETGAEKIISTAEEFGFGKETVFADGMKAASGVLPAADELDSYAALSNISFGQGSLLATPVQICSMMAAIADDGVYKTPYLIEGTVDAQGQLTRFSQYSERRQIISRQTARKLRSFLEKVTEYGSGKRAAGNSVMTAGKTATAQTGKSKNGEEIYNAWFAGYFPADNPKYAVAILIEDGGEGALSCAPIFKNIADAVTATEKNSDE